MIGNSGAVEALTVRQIEALLDHLPKAPFFVKDSELRYVGANTAMVELCGARHRTDIIGRSASKLFPPALTERFENMDRSVIRSCKPIRDRLELVQSLHGPPAWLLFGRWPVIGVRGKVIGVAAISRNLDAPDRRDPAYARVSRAVEQMQARLAEPFDIRLLARESGVSPAKLERDFVRVFGVSPRRYLIKARLDCAYDLLDTDKSIAEIAHMCGYKDHSAFTRQFQSVFGVPPSAYRRMLQT